MGFLMVPEFLIAGIRKLKNCENNYGASCNLADRSNQNHRMMLLLFRLMINFSKSLLETLPKDVLASRV